jgi:hypothetical protein
MASSFANHLSLVGHAKYTLLFGIAGLSLRTDLEFCFTHIALDRASNVWCQARDLAASKELCSIDVRVPSMAR